MPASVAVLVTSTPDCDAGRSARRGRGGIAQIGPSSMRLLASMLVAVKSFNVE